MRDTLLWEGRKSTVSLEGSQASLARPDKSKVKVRTLEWLKAVT
jgi:hypothetical protein